MEGLYRFARRLLTTDLEPINNHIASTGQAKSVVDAFMHIFGTSSPRFESQPRVEEVQVPPAAEEVALEQQQSQQNQRSGPRFVLPEPRQQQQPPEPRIVLPETAPLLKRERVIKRRRARGGQAGTEITGRRSSPSVSSTPTSIQSSRPSTPYVSSSPTSASSSRTGSPPASPAVFDSNFNINSEYARKKAKNEPKTDGRRGAPYAFPSNKSSGSTTPRAGYSACSTSTYELGSVNGSSRVATPFSGYSTSTYELGPFRETPSSAPSNRSASNYTTSTYELGSVRGTPSRASSAGVGGVCARGILAVPDRCESPSSDMPIPEFRKSPSPSTMRPSPKIARSAFHPYQRRENAGVVNTRVLSGEVSLEVEWDAWMVGLCCKNRVKMWRSFGSERDEGRGCCEWHVGKGGVGDVNVGVGRGVEGGSGEGCSKGVRGGKGKERIGRRSREDAGVGSSRGSRGRYGDREDDFEEVRKGERTRSRSPPRRSSGVEERWRPWEERTASPRRGVDDDQPARRWAKDDVMSERSTVYTETLVVSTPEPLDYEEIRRTALPGVTERLLNEDEGYRRWAIANYLGMTPEEFYS
ncbi:hypothetical protein HDU97_001261 [Phlyctochytrium planicorne]|nr:hypothetical protein HDU97_001261 [Phlyctochytrium planicorne]